MERPLIDLDMLRVIEPDRIKRAVWLFGAQTAVTRGLTAETKRATHAVEELSAFFREHPEFCEDFPDS